MEQAGTRRQRGAIVLKVNAVSYLREIGGSTHPNRYIPGEWSVESPVAVRREGDKIFLKRANGKELETAIVQKSPQRPVLWQKLI